MDHRDKKKADKTLNKPIYVSPSAMRLDDIYTGEGICRAGSSEVNLCTPGSNANIGTCRFNGSSFISPGRCKVFGNSPK